MRASGIPVALSAFALGLIVAQGASWLMNDGDPEAALAKSRDELRPALSIGDSKASLVGDGEMNQAATANTAVPNRVEQAVSSEPRAALGGQANVDTRTDSEFSDVIAQLYEENPEDFIGLIVEKLIEDGDPLRALALIKETPNAGAYLYSQVGEALKKAGHVAAAIESYGEGVRLDPLNSDSFRPLLELDASAALMIIQEGLAWQPPPGNAEMRTRLAEALLAAGQEEEATKLVEAMRAEGIKQNALTKLYGELSPEAAEAELRGLVEKAQGKKKSGPLRKLAEMLERAGRKEDALAAVDSILELDPNNARARQMLLRLNPEAGIEHLAARTVANPKSTRLWSDYGNALEAQGRKVDAIAAWEQAVSLSGNYGAVRKLLEHSPDTVWTNLETFTQNSGDDERWGDFGDLMWENDRKDQAKRAWEKAWELDPNDTEWYGKLQAIQVGRNPFD